MIKKESFLFTKFFLFVYSLAIFFLFTFSISAASTTISLDQEDIINLSKPAIVKIYHQISGKLDIPTIKLDIKTMSLSIDNSFVATPKTTYIAYPDSVISYKFNETIDPNKETYYGTGFIINSDGYIVTNAHVVTNQEFLKQLERNLINDMIGAFDKKYPGKLDQMYPNDAEWAPIYNKLDIDMFKLVSDNAEINSDLVVIPQSFTDATPENIFNFGFDAKIISATDNFLSNNNQDKDLAIIKIEQNNLPALKIDTTNSTRTGQKIFVWGFPSSAEFNGRDLISPTLTDGIVSAFKDSSDRSFRLIQTDAKISHGSSGSPILNEKGEVIGIITFISDGSESTGDSFGWGVPADLIQQVIKDSSVSNNVSYYDNFSSGIVLMNNKRCKSAIEKFNNIKNTNEKFPVTQYIQTYIDKCTDLISSGQSIDSFFALILVSVKEFIYKAWMLIIILLVCITGLIFMFLKLKRQNKDEEIAIESIKKSLGQDETELNKIEIVVDSQGKEIENLKSQSKK